MPIASPDEVLGFWFGDPPRDAGELMAKVRRWFQGGEALDRAVVERFGGSVEAALDGHLEEWESTPRGRLALVILLDQFTRNVFRGSARTYAGDPRAQEIAVRSFADGSAAALAYVEQLFLSLPLLHAENAPLQRRAAEIARSIAASAPELYRPMAAMHREQTEKYCSIIERFGRFPHRNVLLGRVSTAAEVEFLAGWDEHAAPRGMQSGS